MVGGLISALLSTGWDQATSRCPDTDTNNEITLHDLRAAERVMSLNVLCSVAEVWRARDLDLAQFQLEQAYMQ